MAPASVPSTATSGAPAGAWNCTDHIPLANLVVQGHRGVGALAEENTVEAFELAWRMGLHPEADLRMTRDGIIVPFHDPDFSRVVKDAPESLRRLGVEHLTYAELARLDVGSWKGEQFRDRHVVRLAAIFELMQGRPDRHLYMDVKQVDFPRLAAEVTRCGLERQVVLASHELGHLRVWRALVPASDTLLWLHDNAAGLQATLSAQEAAGFAGVTQIQIHVYPKVTDDGWAPPADPSPADNPFRLPNAFLREIGDRLRAHGVLYQAIPWTDAAGVYAQLLDLGVMSLATDHPVLTMNEVRAYYAAKIPRRPPAGS